MCMQATYSSVLVKIVSLFLISPILIGSAAARSLTLAVAWQLFPKHLEKREIEILSLGIKKGDQQPVGIYNKCINSLVTQGSSDIQYTEQTLKGKRFPLL